MSTALRARLRSALAEKDTAGVLRPPGGTCGVRIVEADGSELVAAGRGDGMDLFFAPARGPVVAFACAPGTVLRLAWFIVVRWWFWRMWCGVKLLVWRWAQRRA